MIRAVIIDDEFLARQRLLKLLEEHDNVQVVGEARNGKLGVELIQTKEPELIFLDIQMPDLNGFEVISNLNKVPHVIFTTAFDQYALKAFDISAIDYLLKPFDEERLAEALGKAEKQLTLEKSADVADQMRLLMRSLDVNDTKYRKSFIIKEKGFDKTVFCDDVMLFEAQGNYVQLTTADRDYLFRISMNALQDELNPNDYVRIHRAYILNKRYVQKHVYQGNNEFEFTLKSGQKVLSSRSMKGEVMNAFGK